MSNSLPTIASRIVTVVPQSFERTLEKVDLLSGDPNSSSPVVIGIMSSDPVLTALALGRANAISASDLTQLSNAVLMLGMSTVQGLVREVQPIPPQARKVLAASWSLANAAATMTKILATHSPTMMSLRQDDETLHAAGLLHDLGTMVACLHFPNEYQRAGERIEREDTPFATLLKDELGADAAELGAMLAKMWNLPELIATCIRYHLRPMKADGYTEIVSLVHVARTLVRACGFCTGADVYLDPIDEDALDFLGLHESQLEGVIKQFYDDMEELELYESVLVAQK
jgi:HD-like signal output (HDOD) protein